MFKKYKSILTLSIIIVLLPIIINFILLIKTPIPVAENNDWISFFGGYIGGVTTLLGVWFTIDYYRKKDEEERNKADEKARLSLMPYFKVVNLDSLPQYYKEVFFSCIDSTGMMTTLTSPFMIKNVGLGTAVDVNFLYLTNFDWNADSLRLTLAVKDEEHIELNIQIPEDGIGGNTLWLTINYADLLGNKYEQAISLRINLSVQVERYYIAVVGTLPPRLLEKS
ncbi:hypothetical protein SAMN05660297_02943 [Natronincola peptidivorans]|uniref:Uncharacterized protein n=1 Tax=Natronincola peptidivorans TaxID=426128 RepID=A0A1I0FVP5_9FIRM|nr:hypothetical protein [Natronincola peptidivorans]SET61736.1 hypothetical protein SAMN05660297_02943 [Natronincola peptidivorans]